MAASTTRAAAAASQQVRKTLDIPGLFKQLIALPTVTRAHFLAHTPTPHQPHAPVWLTTAQKSVDTDETRTVQQILTWQEGAYRALGYPTGLEVIASLPSPSRRLLANIRNAPVPKGATPSKTPNYAIEIVDADPNSPTNGRVLHVLTSTASMHGKILLTGPFGSLVWNRAETALVYMAEPKAEDRKPATFFPTPEEEEKQRARTEPSTYPTKGTEFEAKEEWGEAMVGVVKPRPFVLRFTPEDGIKLHGVRGIPEEYSAGQAIWSGWSEKQYSTPKNATPSFASDSALTSEPLFDEGLYLTIYPNNQEGGRKLGISAYNTRESKICYLSARFIVDTKRDNELKKAKETREREAKEAEADARKARGEVLTPEQEQAAKDAEYAAKHAELQREKRENHLIVLTPNDHSASNPRLDGFDSPQMVYTTTDRVWHHIACSKLKTFIALPSTLQRFMQLVEADKPIETRPDGQEVAPTATSASSVPASSPSPSPISTTMKVFHSNTHEMIPIVEKPANEHAFPGLWPYANLLPAQSRFVFDRSHILIVSSWRAQSVILMCCDEDDSLSRLPLPIDAPIGASMSLYDVDRTTGRLIVGVSSLAQPESLYIAEVRILAEGQNVAIGEDFLPVPRVHKDHTPLAANEEAEAVADDDDEDHAYAQVKYTPLLAEPTAIHPEARRRIAGLSMEVIPIDVAGDQYEDGTPQLPFEAILLTPKIDRTKPLPPLIAFPHGGPHAASSTAWISHAAFHACVGVSLLFINYRGSTGYGQAMLNTLPGRCGELDVADCMRAIDTVLARTGKDAVADRSNVHVQGGSHGGFLTTHLLGQHPDRFRTGVARNPVTNIAHMVGTSDIPDWCMFEATGRYDPCAMPTAADYQQLFRASPIAHISRVRAPLLMMLGGADRRVPMSQANDYVKLLTARGVRTRTLLYPDGQHPLAENVLMEADVWTNMIMWALERFDAENLDLPNHAADD